MYRKPQAKRHRTTGLYDAIARVDARLLVAVDCNQLGIRRLRSTWDQVERTTPVRINGSRMTAGGLPVNARSRALCGSTVV